jgi:alcohol dehydrogenase (cytochrome c)
MKYYLAMKTLILAMFIGFGAIALAQVGKFVPVTQEMLVNPSPDDWLMYSRTYDAQRFSPLKQITRQNVNQLGKAWSKELGTGTLESIPIVYRGVMYLVAPGAVIQALDAKNGNLIWEYKRPVPTPAVATTARTKTIAIYEDVILYTAPDSFIVGLDARTGAVRWETQTNGGLTSGPIVVEGKVLTGRTCGGQRANCYISAHDARTGKEAWRFYTAAGSDDPGGATWGGAPEEKRVASTWGLPGSYDPARKLLYWGVANPTPNTRSVRHGGNPDAISRSAPADLYSNSTLALDPNTGKLVWYYQHLPGDDWDLDYTHERTLLRTSVNPDPKFVKWINPDIPRGQQRDMAVTVGEGGGLWALDRITGQFLWATPVPFDVPNFLISKIDVKTGKTYINWDVVSTKPGETHVVCFHNTRSYWPTAYSPANNSLYFPYLDNCLEMTSATAGQPERRTGIQRPGSDPNALGGLAKVNMSTGELTRIYTGRAPGNGAILATAGGLIFWGDLNEKFRAFDGDSGKILWETTLVGAIQNSTITYAVGGKQYVAVFTGEGQLTGGLIEQAGIKPARKHNALYVFALP